MEFMRREDMSGFERITRPVGFDIEGLVPLTGWGITMLKDVGTLPEIKSLYMICNETCEAPLYIGKTVNLKRRWQSGHHVFPKLFAGAKPPFCIMYLHCPHVSTNVLDGMERYYIKKYNPKYNSQNPQK